MGQNLTYLTNNKNRLQFQSNHFAEGSLRYAFRAKIIQGPNKGERAVVKAFKSKSHRRTRDLAQKQLESYYCANLHAKDFNQQIKKRNIEGRITFPKPDLVEIKNLHLWRYLTSSYFQEGDYVCAQVYLKGTYKKWTNNFGYIGQGVGAQLMEAFQHFTFVKSDGQLLVCDLQGVQDGNTFILTDPAVNSVKQKFGDTDIGKKGLQNILKGHKCNKLCDKLDMSNWRYDNNFKPVKYSTTARRSHSINI